MPKLVQANKCFGLERKNKSSNGMVFIKKIGIGWDIRLKSDVHEGETILGEFISSLVLRLKGISQSEKNIMIPSLGI